MLASAKQAKPKRSIRLREMLTKWWTLCFTIHGRRCQLYNTIEGAAVFFKGIVINCAFPLLKKNTKIIVQINVGQSYRKHLEPHQELQECVKNEHLFFHFFFPPSVHTWDVLKGIAPSSLSLCWHHLPDMSSSLCQSGWVPQSVIKACGR